MVIRQYCSAGFTVGLGQSSALLCHRRRNSDWFDTDRTFSSAQNSQATDSHVHIERNEWNTDKQDHETPADAAQAQGTSQDERTQFISRIERYFCWLSGTTDQRREHTPRIIGRHSAKQQCTENQSAATVQRMSHPSLRVINIKHDISRRSQKFGSPTSRKRRQVSLASCLAVTD